MRRSCHSMSYVSRGPSLRLLPSAPPFSSKYGVTRSQVAPPQIQSTSCGANSPTQRTKKSSEQGRTRSVCATIYPKSAHAILHSLGHALFFCRTLRCRNALPGLHGKACETQMSFLTEVKPA